MGDSSEECHVNELLVLVLDGRRLMVDKQLIYNKSRYFNSLLSTNFNDYHQEEHVINYDIPLTTLTDFIAWLQIEIKSAYHYESIGFLSKYQKDLKGLLKLLDVAVLFAVDDLIDDITVIIEKYWLLPHYVIEIWLLTEELALKLQDILMAACLENFSEIPLIDLLNLTSEKFTQLVGNINVAATDEYLQDVISKWKEHNPNDECEIHLIREREPKILQILINFIYDNNNHLGIQLCCFDGENLCEYSKLEYPEENIFRLIGMQHASKGYNLYFCGGEYGIGTGRFNMNVWRYSLLSKKWCIITYMPIPRRHMITAIIGNHLILMGGVGKYRKKLTSIDIYDISEHKWTAGTNMNISFIYPPIHCIANGKLFFALSSYVHMYIYEYSIDKNKWKKDRIHCTDVPFLISCEDKDTCYFITLSEDKFPSLCPSEDEFNMKQRKKKHEITDECTNNVYIVVNYKQDCINDGKHINSIRCQNNLVYVTDAPNTTIPSDKATVMPFPLYRISSSNFNSSNFSILYNYTRKFIGVMDPSALYARSDIYNSSEAHKTLDIFANMSSVLQLNPPQSEIQHNLHQKLEVVFTCK